MRSLAGGVFRWALVVSVPFAILTAEARAQCDGNPGPDGLTWEFDEEESGSFSIVGFLGSALTPQLVKDTRAMRSYVRDPRFAELRRRCGDLRAVDGIFQKALRVAEFSIGRALFLAMMASLEHQSVHVDMPLVGAVGLPLTFEEDSLFQGRIRNLPVRIYVDSPSDEHGDRDKLQHFFGSAYLAYASGSPEVARATGNFVEWGEARMIVGGVDDVRDRRANKQGETFGHDLLYVKTLLPSDYLTLPVKVE
jgi:hypothetical protein